MGTNKIRSILVKTNDVKKSLKKYASSHGVTTQECTFTIRAVKTYLKTYEDNEFQLFNENVDKTYENKDKLLNDHLEFKQVYSLEMKLLKTSRIKLNYSLDIGEFSSHPYIIIEPDSEIPYKKYKPKDIYVLLLKEINKIKVENRILINIFDTIMIETIKKFIKHIYTGKFNKKIKILLFEGVEPEITKNSGLTLHFKNKKQKQKLIEVEKGELLVEFTKPFFGKNGFNSHGEIIDSGLGSNFNDIQVKIDKDSILIKEDGDKKLYISKLKGFVTLNDIKFEVANKFKMSKISRLTESLSDEEDNNIEIIVSQHDTSEDSVGEGAVLISESLHITGHVGAHSVLEAVNLQIDGATHKKSNQFAKDAKINRHKGTLRCNKADISVLEGGIIHATTVNVDTSLGGEVHAKDVTIRVVKNNLKVYASNSITIDNVSGEDNILKINYKDVPVLASKIKLLLNDIETLKDDLEEAKNHNISQVDGIEEKIINLTHEQNKIEKSTLHAKINVSKPFIGQNQILFVLDNGDELLYKTLNKKYDPFYLEVKQDKITLHPVHVNIFLKS